MPPRHALLSPPDDNPIQSNLVLVALGLFFTVGCFEDTGGGSSTTCSDEVGDGDGDGETGGDGGDGDGDPPGWGPCWCATVTGAEIDPPMGPNYPVEDPLNGDGSPKACIGASPDEHEDLVTIASGTPPSAVVTALHTSLVDFRDAVFDKAENYCNDLADAQSGPGSTNDCYDILVEGTSPLVWEEDKLCLEVGQQAPPDHWSDYYNLIDVIHFNRASGIYEIDEEFFDDVLYNAWWLWQDSAYIALDGSSAFAFFDVQPGDVVHALGITTNDIPRTLNELDITSTTAVAAAYSELWGESEFELVLLRPGVGLVTRYYEVVP